MHLSFRNQLRNLTRSVVVIATSLLICVTNCQAQAINSNAKKPLNPRLLANHDQTIPLYLRAKAIPQWILTRRFNNDQSHQIKPYFPTPIDIVKIKAAFHLFPQPIQEILTERLIGIYFVENAAFGGTTHKVIGNNDQIYFYFIISKWVLDISIRDFLQKKVSIIFQRDWLTHSVEIETTPTHSALLYILLHESAHGVDFVEGFTQENSEMSVALSGEQPSQEHTKEKVKVYQYSPDQPPPFVGNIWINKSTPVPAFQFSLRKELPFYYYLEHTWPYLKPTTALDLYKHLAKTPFVSLYSTRSASEDFAEYVTWHHLVNNLGISYNVRVFEKGRSNQVFFYQPFNNPLVSARYTTIQSLFH